MASIHSQATDIIFEDPLVILRRIEGLAWPKLAMDGRRGGHASPHILLMHGFRMMKIMTCV
jgi:hypothetical protein